MGNSIIVIVPGKPIAQSRVRFSTKGGQVRSYHKKPAQNYRSWVMTRMLEKTGGTIPFPSGPVRVIIEAIWPLAKSKHRKTITVPREWKTTRPDVDNVVKMILDAANDIMYSDDGQVCDLRTKKMICAQGEQPRIRIFMEEIEGGPK